MTPDERNIICREIAILSMWGHGWIGSSLTEKLDKCLPQEPSWAELYGAMADNARRDHIGTITEEKELIDYLRRGYWLTNFDEIGCSLFNPPPMNGLRKYVAKPIAEKNRSIWR